MKALAQKRVHISDLDAGMQVEITRRFRNARTTTRDPVQLLEFVCRRLMADSAFQPLPEFSSERLMAQAIHHSISEALAIARTVLLEPV